jgi:hypothetical protein
MKNSLISVLGIILLVIVSATSSHAQSVYKLESDKPSFSIVFPAEYSKVESSENEGLKNEHYRAEYNQDVYLFKFAEHKSPKVSGENTGYMQASLESFLTAVEGRLIKKNMFTFGESNGLDAFLTLEKKNMNVFYRVLIVDKVQYQIIVITKDEGKSRAVNNFFNSFISPAT